MRKLLGIQMLASAQENLCNESFFGRMTQEQIDAHIESYEPLEKLVYDYIEKDG